MGKSAVARKLEKSPSTVYRWLNNGVHGLPGSTLSRISELGGVDVQHLIMPGTSGRRKVKTW